MTTNHPDKIDDALLQPGRVDRRLHIGPATRDQAERLFLRFFPGDRASARRFAGIGADGVSMATLQEILVSNSQCPDAAIRAFAAQHERRQNRTA